MTAEPAAAPQIAREGALYQCEQSRYVHGAIQALPILTHEQASRE